MSYLDNVKVVLVETSHTGNMGSAARAMKTMGLSQLCLVNPIIKPDSQAISLSAGASDIIKNAQIVPTLEIAARAKHASQVALVFGRERIGLTNDELQKCHYHVSIPANPDYSSLNLAMSVQILCYEICISMLNDMENVSQLKETLSDLPKEKDIERFYQHLEQTLLKTGFINPNHPGQIMGRLRRMFTRAQIEQQELNILRGILTSIDKNAE